FGVRLDGGNAFTGAEVLPFYDSLLVKLITHDSTFDGAAKKALRALNETRIRGVKTNMGFIGNVLQHPQFLAGACHTKFIDETPELFQIEDSRDRATKMLKYIGNIIVNDPTAGRQMYNPSRMPKLDGAVKPGYKQLLDEKGPKAVCDAVLKEKKLLITDTTMRDAHQSLIATRLRTRDMLRIAPATAEALGGAFSLEMWGGATYDVAYRFLKESPWERLDVLRKKIPNIMFQMLIRGANAVGYTNYPDNLIRAFIQESAKSGIDVFRIFDSLNWIPGMEIAIDEVLKTGKLAEAVICYTGDVSNQKEDKWTLQYYVDMAKQLEKMGAHILAIKDMAGLIKPYAAKKLITALKNEIGIPIHLHTHDTSGNQIATLLMAAECGVDIVDVAVSSMATGTSQPSMDSLVAAMQGEERDTGLSLEKIQGLSDYWADVRTRYCNFESGIKHPATDIYEYEIPGGQYTNLKTQVDSLGLGYRFDDVKKMYKAVNEMMGGIVKVTPSSKMVGDLAIYMVQNDLTPENIVKRGETITFPDSVVSYFKGMMGQPSWGFPKDLQRVVLKGEEPVDGRPGDLLPDVDFEAAREHLKKFTSDPNDRMVISWCFYPKVVEEFLKNRKEFGYINRLSSHVFFHGMAEGETHRVNIDDGKKLVIKYLGKGDVNPDGTRNVMFTLNGVRREVAVLDYGAREISETTLLADTSDLTQVGATIPGMVSKIQVKKGDKVTKNQVLLIVEAMKMETGIVANFDGVVGEILVKEGMQIKAGELLMRINEA
ncbi:MAG: pyruvate carboxylase, partial [Oscillospiraceae bacterium]|nr:pyruvate carboxylase [Oscillospiraceae bacterium]